MNIKRIPLEERPREKLLTNGIEQVSDVELLAIILRTGTKDKSALELASALLYGSEGGLYGLSRNLPHELCEFEGIGIAKACELSAAFELGRRASKRDTLLVRDVIVSAQNVADYFMEDLRYIKQEVFKTVLLDCKGHIISTEQISLGDMTSTQAHPRDIFNAAVRKSAYAIILLHNHPSGDPFPSPEDKLLTQRLSDAGELIGIKIADHVIIGDGHYYSFKEHFLL